MLLVILIYYGGYNPAEFCRILNAHILVESEILYFFLKTIPHPEVKKFSNDY